MTLVLSVSFGIFLAKGRYQQAQEAITSFMSRESFFVWNNVLFTVACGVVLMGTLYPLVVEVFGYKLTVGAPFFNTVVIPIFLALLLLMGLGPLIPWRKANMESLRNRLLIPLVLGTGAAA